MELKRSRPSYQNPDDLMELEGTFFPAIHAQPVLKERVSSTNTCSITSHSVRGNSNGHIVSIITLTPPPIAFPTSSVPNKSVFPLPRASHRPTHQILVQLSHHLWIGWLWIWTLPPHQRSNMYYLNRTLPAKNR